MGEKLTRDSMDQWNMSSDILADIIPVNETYISVISNLTNSIILNFGDHL